MARQINMKNEKLADVSPGYVITIVIFPPGEIYE